MTDRKDPGFPVSGWNGPEPVPDLARIEQARWPAVMQGLSRRTRNFAAARLPTSEEVRHAWMISGELELEEPVERSIRAGRVPDGASQKQRYQRRSRQVNVRLGPNEFADLARAAEEVGATPTQLARLLIVRGARLTLREA